MWKSLICLAVLANIILTVSSGSSETVIQNSSAAASSAASSSSKNATSSSSSAASASSSSTTVIKDKDDKEEKGENKEMPSTMKPSDMKTTTKSSGEKDEGMMSTTKKPKMMQTMPSDENEKGSMSTTKKPKMMQTTMPSDEKEKGMMKTTKMPNNMKTTTPPSKDEEEEGGDDNEDEGGEEDEEGGKDDEEGDDEEECGCEENEVMSSCANGCHMKLCSELKEPSNCKKSMKCEKGCVCKDGYLWDDEGKCVPKDMCKEAANTTSTPLNSTEIENAQKRLEQANQAFTGQFLYDVYRDNIGKSIVMSPFSVLPPLAQLGLYSTGLAHTQIMNLLNLNCNEEIRDIFPVLIESLKSQKSVNFTMAEKVYANIQFPLSTPFKDDAKDVFFADSENLNFDNSQESANTINTWVENQTNNLIKNLVSADSLNSGTELVLVNALYFKGNWTHQFNTKNTKKRKFYLNSTDCVQLDIMYQKNKFNYADSKYLDAQLLQMFYEGGNFSLFLILPHCYDGLGNLMQKIVEPDAIKNALNEVTSETCHVYIPKVDGTTSIDVTKILKKSNVTQIFNTSDSGLTGIMDKPGNLFVSSIIQKAYVRVDEMGTEAAAANAFMVGSAAAMEPTEEFTFNADHPLAFLILFEDKPIFCGAFTGK